MANRTGVKVLCEDYGVSHDIVLRALHIHDVNGSLIKQKGGGSGILIVNRGKDTPSTFDGLRVEDCIIRRCERNGIIWSGYSDREHWHPNTRTVIRKNLIEEVLATASSPSDATEP